MTRKLGVLIILGLALLLLPLIAFSESKTVDGLTVTFDKTEVNAGDSIIATYKFDNDGMQFIQAEWHCESLYGWGHVRPFSTEPIDNTLPFRPEYNGCCFLQITCIDKENYISVYKSDNIPVHGLTIDYVENPELINTRFMNSGEKYTCDITISNFGDDFPSNYIAEVELTAKISGSTLRISKEEYKTNTFSVSYTPSAQMYSFMIFVHVHNVDNTSELKWEREIYIHDKHNLVKYDRIDPTVTEKGTEEYWKCELCEKMFSDSEGKNEINEPVNIPELVEPIDLSKAKISKISNQVYTGKSIKPEFTVKYKDRTLTEGTDYIVKWKDNKNPGKATVTIKGKGKNKGEQTATFKILPKPVELSSLKARKKSLTAKWKKGSKIDGYEIQYSLKSNFKSAKEIEISGASTKKTEINGLKKKKTYYVRIRAYKEIDGKKYYSEWSDPMEKKTK